MRQSPMSPEERFAALEEAFAGEPSVTHEGTGFGSSRLKVAGKIFAMLARGALVVKLPRARVDEFVAAGEGGRYDPRRDGRLMKEWLVAGPALDMAWLPLAREALAFVGGRPLNGLNRDAALSGACGSQHLSMRLGSGRTIEDGSGIMGERGQRFPRRTSRERRGRIGCARRSRPLWRCRCLDRW